MSTGALEGRLIKALRFALLVGTVLTLCAQSVEPDLAVALAACFCLTLAWLTTRIDSDIVRIGIIASPTLFYIVTTQIYGLLAGDISQSLLFDRSTAYSIVAVFQAAAFAALVVFRLLVPSLGKQAPLRLITNDRTLGFDALLAFIGTLLVILGFAADGSGVWSSVANLIFPILIVWLAMLLGSGNRKALLIALVMSAVLAVTILLTTGERTPLFALFALWGLWLLSTATHLVKPRFILLLLTAMLGLQAISTITIKARYDVIEGRAADLPSALASSALAPDVWAKALPFVRSQPNTESYSRRANAYYSAFLRGPSGTLSGDFDLLGRLALMAHMDIVTGRWPQNTATDWPALTNLMTASFPDVGQRKMLDYSDHVVWALGLRDRAISGRPLMTPAGELYTMGSYTAVAFITFPALFAVLIWLAALKQMTGYGFAYFALAFALTYRFTLTGTALDLVMAGLRTLPSALVLLMALLFLRKALTGSTSKAVSVAKAGALR